MNSETKKCPYCAEGIPVDAVRCPSCGEILQKRETVQKNEIKLILAIILFIFAIGMFILVHNLYQNRYNVEEISYKNITPIEDNVETLSSKYSVHGMLNKIMEQEEDLGEYMQGKHSEKEKTGVFRLYYKNLQLLVEAFPMELPELGEYDTSYKVLRYLNSYGIKFKPYFINNFYREQDRISYLTFEQPKINLFEIIYVGEGFYGYSINDSYLADTYAKYLNKSWQDYMNNKKRIYDDLEHNNYFDDGVIIPDSSTVAQWAIMWSDFLKKYPKFELKDEIKADIDKYSNDILYRAYKTIFKDGKAFLAEEIREGCEYYLKHADKNTEIYKKIQKDYKTWKDNDFECNDNTKNL